MALLAGACTSADPTDSLAPPNPQPPATAPGDRAGLVDIGDGRSLYLACAGTGSPTVLLLAGKGNGADDWNQILDPADPVHHTPGDDVSAGQGKLLPSDDAVFPSVARFTRVCAYDRPDTRAEGPDRSTSRAQPHTVDLDVSDLHALLAAAGEVGPYILVPHSYSGFIAELFARNYPAEIAGLVLVDPGSSAIEEILSPATLARWAAVQRGTSAQVPEGVEAIDAFARIRAAPAMPQVPTTLLSADKPWRSDLLPPEALHPDDMTFSDWLDAQGLLATRLGAKHITRTHSGHNIYLYAPGLVTEEIRALVELVRSAR